MSLLSGKNTPKTGLCSQSNLCREKAIFQRNLINKWIGLTCGTFLGKFLATEAAKRADRRDIFQPAFPALQKMENRTVVISECAASNRKRIVLTSSVTCLLFIFRYILNPKSNFLKLRCIIDNCNFTYIC